MKIFYIVNARIPTEKAHGVQIMKMCEAFTTLGAEVTLVVPWRTGVKKVDPFAHYDIHTKFKIVYVPILDTYAMGYVGFILGALSFSIVSFLYGTFLTLKERLNTHGDKHHNFIFYSRDQDQFSFLSFFFGLRPYFFEVHGLKEKGALHERLFAHVSGVVATNSFIENKLIEHFPRLKGKTIMEPNGVDAEMFRPVIVQEARKKLSLPLDKKIVMYTGHFYEWKGVGTLVEAAAFLPADVEVYLVGGNDEDTERLKKQYPAAAKRVHFLGYRPYPEIPLWCSASDALVITGTARDANSVNYTSPIKLFEYLVTSRPVIAVDSPAIRDVVSEREVYFYNPDNVKSLETAILRVLANPAEVAEKVAAANKKGLGFEWKKRAARILDFLQK